MKVSIDALGIRISGTTIVDDVTIAFDDGQTIGLIGPNGSGKSTILKTISRALAPTTGRVRLDDRELSTMSPRESARSIAAMGQEHGDGFEFSVRDVVAVGRTPHLGAFDRERERDRRLIDDCLERVGLAAHRDRAYASLSGGEKQRAALAAALAQEPRVLVLDEPTNHLDIATQLELLELVTSLDVTSIIALHDLNLAASYCDRIHVIDAGRVVASGTPSVLFADDAIAEVFRVRLHRGVHPATGRPQLFFSPLHPESGPTPRTAPHLPEQKRVT